MQPVLSTPEKKICKSMLPAQVNTILGMQMITAKHGTVMKFNCMGNMLEAVIACIQFAS